LIPACGAGLYPIHGVTAGGACRYALDAKKREKQPDYCKMLQDANDRGEGEAAGEFFAMCDTTHFRAELESKILDVAREEAKKPPTIVRDVIPWKPDPFINDWDHGRLIAAVLSRDASGACACTEYVFRQAKDDSPAIQGVGSRMDVACEDVGAPNLR
jgi:hypothetical protein